MIAIVDYGMGNLRSVQKALETVGGKTRIISNEKGLLNASKIVLPGVGAFSGAMEELKNLGLIEPIKRAIRDGAIFLGLCLGLQLLFDESEEGGRIKGLGIFKGKVRRFNFTGHGLKIPHMGWNNIKIKNKKSKIKMTYQNPKIISGVPDGSYMYFVHSYYAAPKDKSIILTNTDYGIEFASGIWKDNIYAFQFHPEKSQKTGLKILSNFVKL